MYQFRTLSNGIRVVSEKIDYLKSVSIGVWIGNGSRFEKKNENGMSHFIEHMLFKGTNNREAIEIAKAIDRVGGQINAFTTREYTCYYTKTIDARIAMDILSDMLFNSRFDTESVNLERQVIAEEIYMYEDSPEDLVYDILSEAVWGDTSMGRPILGTKESLEGIDSAMMKAYVDSHYTSKNTVISVSGNFDEHFFDQLEFYFGSKNICNKEPELPKANYTPRSMVRTKDIEQVQIVAAFNGIDVMDENVYSLLVFNNIFGSGMSSRLFQNIRENRGLVYSVYASHSSYINTGIFDISAGMNPNNVKKVAELISDEVNRIKKEKLSDEEVQAGKEQLRGSYILSYESTSARMQGNGRSLLLNKPIYTQDEILAKIDAVNKDSVADVIDKVLDTSTLSVAAVGPIDDVEGLFSLN